MIGSNFVHQFFWEQFGVHLLHVFALPFLNIFIHIELCEGGITEFWKQLSRIGITRSNLAQDLMAYDRLLHCASGHFKMTFQKRNASRVTTARSGAYIVKSAIPSSSLVKTYSVT